MSLLPNTPAHKWTKYAMYILTVVFSLSIFLGWSLSTFLTCHPSVMFLSLTMVNSPLQRGRKDEEDRRFVDDFDLLLCR